MINVGGKGRKPLATASAKLGVRPNLPGRWKRGSKKKEPLGALATVGSKSQIVIILL